MMDLSTRRQLLGVSPNPNNSIDYVTGYEGRIGAPALEIPADIMLRYVPDRLILEIDSLEKYLEAIEQKSWDSLESLAVTVLDDIRNELVARWVQIVVRSQPSGHPHLHRHAITLEDYQPNWDNEELLSHLALI
jgi:7-cyano-7-deazaguanine reductase